MVNKELDKKVSTRKLRCGQLRSDNGHPAKVFTRSRAFLPPWSFEPFLNFVVLARKSTQSTSFFAKRQAKRSGEGLREELVERINEKKEDNEMKSNARRLARGLALICWLWRGGDEERKIIGLSVRGSSLSSPLELLFSAKHTLEC